LFYVLSLQVNVACLQGTFHQIIADPLVLCFTVQYQCEMGQTNYYYYLT